jgi:hypothetical protein
MRMNVALELGARRARAAIASGALRGAALRELLRSVPFGERDVWVDELLGLPELPVDVSDLPRGAAPYLPSGVDEIVAMTEEAPLGPCDELVDLGSGLGRVVILAHLLSAARASGVEIQSSLVENARSCSAGLALDGVSFVHGNAADLELDGSIFYLYAPFHGEMMTRVVRRLEAVARRRPIIVCAVGLEFHEPWLRARKTSCPSLTLYDSVFCHRTS